MELLLTFLDSGGARKSWSCRTQEEPTLIWHNLGMEVQMLDLYGYNDKEGMTNEIDTIH